VTLKISSGNTKMGAVPSVSLPAGETCRDDCECSTKCYAKRLERLRPSVRAAYQSNLDLLKNDPDTYWREVEASVMMSRFFRFHVSGDIPNENYLARMIDIAKRNQHCQILCFTKKYGIVNQWIDSHIKDDLSEVIPNNLHLVFSVWRNLLCDNPYILPEAHVRYRDGTTTVQITAQECKGNCAECAVTDSGCWTLGQGESVVFNEH